MNLDHQLSLNRRLLQQKNQHQNLRQLQIEKDQTEANHRMFFLQVHPIRKVNLKVKHPMMNLVTHHYQIIIKQKQNLFLQLHQKNHQYHHHQFQKESIKSHLQLKLILKKSQQILNQSHHQLMIINNRN
jgi:hypothetical protein